MLSTLAVASLKRRKSSVLLTLLSIVIGVSMLLTVEAIRGQVKSSFTRTVSGVDIIVGAPSGQLNLLLSSVFRLGSPTQGIPWDSVKDLASSPSVRWAIPFAMGDAHQGFRVVGTTNAYFDHFKYGDKTPLGFQQGTGFTTRHSAVLGADVADALQYGLDDEMVISHGIGHTSFQQHDEHPFVVSGILARTGTPVDKAVYVTLAGLEQVHATQSPASLARPGRLSRDGHRDDAGDHHDGETHEHEHQPHHGQKEMAAFTPSTVSVVMLGLKNRAAALQLQYKINQSKTTPLMAILPGMALAELWQIMGNVEGLLLAISVLIMVSSLFGLTTMLLATMRERRHEIAVLRTIGAGPMTLLKLIQIEALLISILGCAISVGLVSLLLWVSKGWLSGQYGLFLSANIFNPTTLVVVIAVLGATCLIAFIPALMAYRTALNTGMKAH